MFRLLLLFFNFYQIQNLLKKYRRDSRFRVQLNRCFNAVRFIIGLRMINAFYFFEGRVRICFSFVPNEGTSSSRFCGDIFPFDLNDTCFMLTSQFLYCMSGVLRRKVFEC